MNLEFMNIYLYKPFPIKRTADYIIKNSAKNSYKDVFSHGFGRNYVLH